MRHMAQLPLRLNFSSGKCSAVVTVERPQQSSFLEVGEISRIRTQGRLSFLTDGLRKELTVVKVRGVCVY